MSRANFPNLWLVLALAGGLLVLAGPALADDVYLVNGQVFEGVMAEQSADRVVIQLDIGQLTLPRSHVLKVVSAETPLERYLARSRVLRDSIEATASDWLELARFAQSHDLVEGYRDAALLAARLDPDLAGVELAMKQLGYALDDETHAWVPESEVMRKRGLVRYDGQWVAEVEARRRQQEREIAALRAAQAAPVAGPPAPAGSGEREPERGPTDNEVLIAQVELMKDVVDALERPPIGVSPGVVGYPMVLGWGFGGASVPATPQAAAAWDAMTVRQPGSMIPVSSFVREP